MPRDRGPRRYPTTLVAGHAPNQHDDHELTVMTPSATPAAAATHTDSDKSQDDDDNLANHTGDDKSQEKIDREPTETANGDAAALAELDEKLLPATKQVAILLLQMADTEETHTQLTQLHGELDQGTKTASEFLEDTTVQEELPKLLQATNSWIEQLRLAWEQPYTCDDYYTDSLVSCVSLSTLWTLFGIAGFTSFILSTGLASLDTSSETLQAHNAKIQAVCGGRAASNQSESLFAVGSYHELEQMINNHSFPGLAAMQPFMGGSAREYELVDRSFAGDFLSVGHNVIVSLTQLALANESLQAQLTFDLYCSQSKYPEWVKKMGKRRSYESKEVYWGLYQNDRTFNLSSPIVSVAISAFIDAFRQHVCSLIFTGSAPESPWVNYLPGEFLKWPDFKQKFEDYNTNYRTAFWVMTGLTAFFIIGTLSIIAGKKWQHSEDARKALPQQVEDKDNTLAALDLYKQRKQLLAKRQPSAATVEIVSDDDNDKGESAAPVVRAKESSDTRAAL